MFFQYFKEILGSHWERLGAAFGNALGSPLGGLGDAMGGLGDALGTPWGRLGRPWGRLGGEPPWKTPKKELQRGALRKIAKNCEDP